jgi:hypothetical protein
VFGLPSRAYVAGRVVSGFGVTAELSVVTSGRVVVICRDRGDQALSEIGATKMCSVIARERPRRVDFTFTMHGSPQRQTVSSQFSLSPIARSSSQSCAPHPWQFGQQSQPWHLGQP